MLRADNQSCTYDASERPRPRIEICFGSNLDREGLTLRPRRWSRAGFKQSPDVVTASLKIADDQKGFATDGRFDLEGFRNVLNLRAEMLGTWGGKPPAPEKYLDLSYYDRALKGLSLCICTTSAYQASEKAILRNVSSVKPSPVPSVYTLRGVS